MKRTTNKLYGYKVKVDDYRQIFKKYEDLFSTMVTEVSDFSLENSLKEVTVK